MQVRTLAVSPIRKLRTHIVGSVACVSVVLGASTAHADPPPDFHRDSGWGTATTIMSVAAVGLQVVSPRTFYSDPEVTAGWKARWHLSVLAPTMAIGVVTLWNELNLKGTFGGERPGCEGDWPRDVEIQDPTTGSTVTQRMLRPAECQSFGMMSSETFAAFSALGHGIGVFLIDTTKWSNGQFHGGAFALEVGVPAVLAVLTAVGRTSGNWESAGQVWGTAPIGLGVGFGLGLLYAALQRPECGYTGSLICW